MLAGRPGFVTSPAPTTLRIDAQPAAGDALAGQIAKRGVVLPTDVEIVWTQTPAAEVLDRCSKGQRATMVAALSDVQRFFDEIEPTVWVLDRQRLNLTAAMNVASRIALCSRTRGPRPNPSGGSK